MISAIAAVILLVIIWILTKDNSKVNKMSKNEPTNTESLLSKITDKKPSPPTKRTNTVEVNELIRLINSHA